jgi:F0F1-type ATP synthase membrane subunit b/b'
MGCWGSQVRILSPRPLFVGMWLSLVERLVRDQEVVGSNPTIPTSNFPDRRGTNMIEEFIQSLQQAEVEADGVLKSAREKVRTIEHDSESCLAKDRASAELLLQRQLDAIDQETNQKMKLAEDQLRQDLKEQLEGLERRAQDRRSMVLDLLLSKLTAC